MILQDDGDNVLLVGLQDAAQLTLPLDQFRRYFRGHIIKVIPRVDPAADPDSDEKVNASRQFGV